MSAYTAFWQSIEATSIGSYIASSEWGFPLIETCHVIALVTVFGSIAFMDLRMLGLVSRNSAVTAVSRETLPFTWGAFLIAAITGSLLFVSKASSYMVNPWFLAKMCMIAIAGMNMILFHFITWKSIKDWDTATIIPTSVKIAGGLSLSFWLIIVFCGRMIGFTLGIYVPS
ncbi:MAG: hypothetical protein J7494_06420 [Sphingobium sp.]|nr:hypothetical protein [Sphingobium sp.]